MSTRLAAFPGLVTIQDARSEAEQYPPTRPFDGTYWDLTELAGMLTSDPMLELYESVVGRRSNQPLQPGHRGDGQLEAGAVVLELVGPRRSFRGKCYVSQRRIRMPVWPDTWLLDWTYTLLHELAHLLDDDPRPHGRSFYQWQAMVQDEALRRGVLSPQTHRLFVSVAAAGRACRGEVCDISYSGVSMLHAVGSACAPDRILPL